MTADDKPNAATADDKPNAATAADAAAARDAYAAATGQLGDAPGDVAAPDDATLAELAAVSTGRAAPKRTKAQQAEADKRAIANVPEQFHEQAKAEGWAEGQMGPFA